ncbi:MAG: HlyC/CorC family transporter [Kofleriaceae bacterium]|nr:HlyC/CorC family transporter [Kofleriaceae bacterium]
MASLSLTVTLILIAVGVLLSAFFSGTEVAIFGLRRVDRDQMTKSERAVDHRALTLLAVPRQLIAAVLIGNELVNSYIAVLVLGAAMLLMPASPPWLWAVVAVAISLPILVLLGEVTPKSVALASPLTWVRIAVSPLALVVNLVTPLRYILQGIADRICALVGAAPKKGGNHDMSPAEFRNLVDAGSAQGQVNARERRLIHRVFEFSDKNVGQIMTPRERMFALSFDLPMARLVKEVTARGFSRIPIYQKSIDNIRGIINAKDLVRGLRQPGTTLGLAELLHEPLFVPRTTPVKRLFLTFKQKKVHFALVVNEYGKVLGVVTMDDVLSQLFGVLRDERERQQSAGRKLRTPPQGIAVHRIDASDVVPKLEPDVIAADDSLASMQRAQAARPLGNTGTADVVTRIDPAPSVATEEDT